MECFAVAVAGASPPSSSEDDDTREHVPASNRATITTDEQQQARAEVGDLMVPQLCRWGDQREGSSVRPMRCWNIIPYEYLYPIPSRRVVFIIFL
jgi:hypothetical protein